MTETGQVLLETVTAWHHQHQRQEKQEQLNMVQSSAYTVDIYC